MYVPLRERNYCSTAPNEGARFSIMATTTVSRDGEPTLGVFVLHGRKGKRLPLRRGLHTVEEALAFANHVREERFHDPEKVIIVREGDGEIVTEPDAPAQAGGDGGAT